MKRTAFAGSRRRSDGSQGEQGFWPSYADMMSAVALILFFLMLLSYIQNLITGNDLQNTQELLESTRLKLSETQKSLSDTEQSLSITRSEVTEAQEQLSKITIDLDEARLTLQEQQSELESQKQDLAAQDKLLADQAALIGKQEDYLKAAGEELLAMRSQMQTIAVLRLSILEQIRDSFVRATGDANKVNIADNGNIILSESILFDVGSSKIKDEAAPALNQLITVFDKFLSDDENAKYVDSIVISGHTDSTGTEESNRILSTDRANSVLDYLLLGSGKKLTPLAGYFCAAGYGETRPVASNQTEAGRSANRRIEISIILKDDSILDVVESYLELELPEGVKVDTQTEP
ncbi:MAG: OmpA family protein [Oscillospiraceae bacterium]|nr:OmpA family protein [Oscillospiraceae bacterium]